ncbi:hypothetical protein RHOSPDRAFT_33465 [Rhodotorula sp. JG-1b]|nr:hypothetical protein RHOSPDRAFT_33465 [Rhodotorula sp. JG-1b]
MSNLEANLRKRLPKSSKDLKPNASLLSSPPCSSVIMVLGWIAPPVAVLVRFGVGWDLFLNIILTILLTSHLHSFYIQNVRNNKTHNRTPKWAIRAGLVKMKDPRAGRHQWANRYDERIGGGDDDSIRSQTWDGRGPEPQRKKPLGGSRRPQRHTLAPWDDYVDEDEVEGGGADDNGLYRTESRRFRDNNDDLLGRDNDNLSAERRTEPEFDPLTNEQFYPAPQVAPIRPTATGGSKKKFGSGLFKHRSRYAEQPFDTTDAVSSRTRGSDADGYQDEFEREINEEAVAHHRTGNGNGTAAGGGRFDTFEAEGPEDAWAAPVPAAAAPAVSDEYKYGNGYAAAQPVRPQRTGRAEETDGDLFNHTF